MSRNIGRKHWFLPDAKTGFSEEWPVENRGPVLGQLVSEGSYGVSFQSGGRIYFATINDCFTHESDANNEHYYREKKSLQPPNP